MLSSVFKNMVGIAQTGAQRGPLELTDEYVEHSQVVEATLDILYNSEITSFTDDKLYHHVIEFARKYDMSYSGSRVLHRQGALRPITTDRH